MTRTASSKVVKSDSSIVFAALEKSWQRSLLATNKSPQTVTTYIGATRLLHEYLASRGMPLAVANLRREHIEAFLIDLRERGPETRLSQ